MTRARLGGLGALALVALGVSGCHTFKYFDINVSFDEGTFVDSDILSISRCRVLVSGADSDNFILNQCPNAAALDPHDGKTTASPGGYAFEYSSFADSGTMKFELKAFTGENDTAACQIGDGMVAIPVTGATTITGSLVVSKTGPGCSSVSPVTDGSP